MFEGGIIKEVLCMAQGVLGFFLISIISFGNKLSVNSECMRTSVKTITSVFPDSSGADLHL